LTKVCTYNQRQCDTHTHIVHICSCLTAQNKAACRNQNNLISA